MKIISPVSFRASVWGMTVSEILRTRCYSCASLLMARPVGFT